MSGVLRSRLALSANDGNSLAPELVSKSTFLYATSLVSAILGYLSVFLAIRYIGEIEYGLVAFGFSIAGLLLFVTDMGLVGAHTKKVSERADLRGCLSVFFYLRFLAIAVYVGLGLIVLTLWGTYFSRDFGDSMQYSVVFVMIVYYVAACFASTFSSTFLALRDVYHAQIIAICDVSVRVVATILVIFFLKTAFGLALTFLVSGSFSLAAAYYLYKTNLPSISFRHLDRRLISDYFGFAMPLAIASILVTVSMNLDKVIIQLYVSVNQTGIYFAFQRILAFYLSIGPAIVAVAFPLVSHMDSRGHVEDQIRRVLSRVLKYLCLLIIPMTFFLAVFSRNVVSALLSSNLSSQSETFSILAISYSIAILTVPFYSQTLGMGDSRSYGRFYVIYSVLVISLDFLLIPPSIMTVHVGGWGISGAAAATLLSQIVCSILFYRKTRSILGIRFPVKEVSRILVSSVIAITVAYTASIFLKTSPLVSLLVLFPIFSATYIAAVHLWKIADVREVIGLLSPGNLRYWRR